MNITELLFCFGVLYAPVNLILLVIVVVDSVYNTNKIFCYGYSHPVSHSDMSDMQYSFTQD